MDPLGVVQACRIEPLARLIEQLAGEADQLAQWGAKIVRDGIEQGLQLRRGGPQRRTPFGQPSLQLASLPGHLLPSRAC